ncbi:VOC family protein [Marinactinospora rubrisoli]|uniref:VOC family protein n=1 Tax=Marinactinospora rubrisoli TaxID=2715399 RepID=A0ABW2KHL3_9ACTN
MIGHLSPRVTDVQISAACYDAVLAPLGGRRLLRPRTAIGYRTDRVTLWPRSSRTSDAARGTHVAVTAADRAAVTAFHEAAAAVGAEVPHAPRPWPEHHDH